MCMQKKIHGGRHSEYTQTDKKTCGQRYDNTPTNVQREKRQRCVEANIKIFMPTKSRQTTDRDDKIIMQADKQRTSQVGDQKNRQTDLQAGMTASRLA